MEYLEGGQYCFCEIPSCLQLETLKQSKPPIVNSCLELKDDFPFEDCSINSETVVTNWLLY